MKDKDKAWVLESIKEMNNIKYKHCPECKDIRPMLSIPRAEEVNECCGSYFTIQEYYRCMGCLKSFKKLVRCTDLEEVVNQSDTTAKYGEFGG